jgi:hypothetical protein
MAVCRLGIVRAAFSHALRLKAGASISSWAALPFQPAAKIWPRDRPRRQPGRHSPAFRDGTGVFRRRASRQRLHTRLVSGRPSSCRRSEACETDGSRHAVSRFELSNAKVSGAVFPCLNNTVSLQKLPRRLVINSKKLAAGGAGNIKALTTRHGRRGGGRDVKKAMDTEAGPEKTEGTHYGEVQRSAGRSTSYSSRLSTS